MVVYFGIYAFNNPDAQAYYIEGTAVSQPELVPIVPNVEAEGVTPVHDQFVLWFKLQFISCMVTFVASPFIGCILMRLVISSPGCGKFVGGFYYCAILALSLTIYIFGLIWRYGEAGSFASGDTLAEDVVADPLY